MADVLYPSFGKKCKSNTLIEDAKKQNLDATVVIGIKGGDKFYFEYTSMAIVDLISVLRRAQVECDILLRESVVKIDSDEDE